MNAIQFIKEKGIDKVRGELNKLPNSNVTHMTNDARMFIDENNPMLDEFQRSQIKDLICIADLKRLVEDIDLLVEHSLSGCWGIDDIYGIEGTGMYLDGYAFYSNAEEKAELDRLQLALDRTVKAFGGEHVL